MADLKKLTQANAAQLLGMSARALRDHADIPRNPDGTYNAAKLVKWARGRSTQVAELPDSDVETIQLIASFFWPESDCQLPAALAAVDDMRERHGDGAVIELVDEVLRRWRDVAEFQEELDADPARQRREAEREREAERIRAARDNLQITTVCDGCDRIRKGRKWKAGKVPKGHAVDKVLCPACKSNG